MPIVRGTLLGSLIGNAMLLVINLPLIGIWVRVLRIPYSSLVPAIILFCCIGAYSLSSSSFDVPVLVGFGVFGYLLNRLGCDAAPLLLAFIIGRCLKRICAAPCWFRMAFGTALSMQRWSRGSAGKRDATVGLSRPLPRSGFAPPLLRHDSDARR